MESIVRVHLANGVSKAVRYDEETTVERVLHVVLAGVGISSVAFPHFALRLFLAPALSAGDGRDAIWLHPMLQVAKIPRLFRKQLPVTITHSNLQFELRLRFIPTDTYELMLTDPRAFYFLHDQVFDDYLAQVAWKINIEPALELAALRVCRDHTDRPTTSMGEKKLDVDQIDVEASLGKFVSETLLMDPANKPAHVRKIFVGFLKRFIQLPTTEIVQRSLATLVDIVRFDVEVFKVSIGAGWVAPVDLLVGPEVSISYRTNERCDISKLAELRSVVEICVRRMDHCAEKSIVQLKLSGSAQPLLITVATTEIAESLAHLIDGYQMMLNQGEPVFKLRGLELCENMELKATKRFIPKRHISPNMVDENVRLHREDITLKELIGGGQFGNVYKGVYTSKNEPPLPVAVKVCKAENEPQDTQLILQEAQLMKQFQHENIISLIGVCADAPIWLVMELAPLGELRQYLLSNKAILDLGILILYGRQVAGALSYLHENNFVHRDIAARNALVSTPSLVKLTDFGLSRALHYDAVYTAAKGKMPIKWMAPESINFREFSMASDVWMFGVCLWEILSWGVKPWVGVSNQDLAGRLEAGARLQQPNICPPALHQYLIEKIWAFEPQKRPPIQEVCATLIDILAQVRHRIPPEAIQLPQRPYAAIPAIRTDISILPNLTLWRTLEEQRRQAEDDEKWLEEEEKHFLPGCSSQDGGRSPPRPLNGSEGCGFNGYHSPLNGGRETLNGGPENGERDDLRPSTSNGFPGSPHFDRNGYNGNATLDHRLTPLLEIDVEAVRQATEKVGTAVTALHNAFSPLMKHEDFLDSIKNITDRLGELFASATHLLQDMTAERRREAESREALIANDLIQMKRVISLLIDNASNSSYNIYRREVLRISLELARNCKTFLELLEAPEGEAQEGFFAVLSDC